MDSAEAAVREQGQEATGTREEQLLAQLARYRVGLTDQQLERIITALERRGGPFSGLHDLTPEQQVVVDAFKNTAQAMGIRGLQVSPAQVCRNGRVVAVDPPPCTVSARIFLQSSVVTVDVEPGAGQIWLPECIRDTDRIARIEYLDKWGVVLGVTGGEKPEKGSGQCSTY
jgi:hypothetical protein